MVLMMIKCCETSRYFSLEIEAPTVSSKLLGTAQLTVQCPCCGKEHSWPRHKVILVSPEEWSPIPQVQDCLFKAFENDELARASTDPSTKRLLCSHEGQVAVVGRWLADNCRPGDAAPGYATLFAATEIRWIGSQHHLMRPDTAARS